MFNFALSNYALQAGRELRSRQADDERHADCRSPAYHWSRGPRLDDRDVGAGVDLTRKGKACAVEKRFVFLQGALPASGPIQHDNVQHLGPIGTGISRNHRFEQKQLRVGRCRLTNRPQNGPPCLPSRG